MPTMLMAPVRTNSSKPPMALGKSGSNTCKNQDRDTVTQTALSDLLAKPHQEHGARRQTYHGQS
jgi:hypothetical protein